LRKRSIIVVPLVLLALIGLMGRRVIRRPLPPPPAPQSPAPAARAETSAPVQVRRGTYRQTDSQGRLLYEVRFASGQFDAQERLAKASGVEAILARPDGPPIFVKAPQLTAAQAEEALHFVSGAKARVADGSAAFSAETLVWEATTRKLIGERGGTFRFGRVEVTGKRLVWDTRSQRVRILGGRLVTTR
jgi:hypothetical protein